VINIKDAPNNVIYLLANFQIFLINLAIFFKLFLFLCHWKRVNKYWKSISISYPANPINPLHRPLNLKDRRRRSEGGEWEPIKILLESLAYISKLTQRPSLLTRPRPHSYNKAIGPRNRARNMMETQNGASKASCKIDDKNRLEKQFISSQAFHRTPGERVQELPRENDLD
jgi:hypothetical protein